MRLRHRGNQAEQTVPDQPATAQPTAADAPPQYDAGAGAPAQPAAGMPPQAGAAPSPQPGATPQPGTTSQLGASAEPGATPQPGASSQPGATSEPGAGMVPPPDADLAPIPAQDAAIPGQDATQSPVPAEAAATEAAPGSAPGTSAQTPAAAHPPQQHVIRRTRIGGVWVGMALAAVVLLLLLVFILENGQSANNGYFGAHGHLPLGVALLLAALAGALLVLIPGTARILQLRKTARRHRKLDAAATAPSPETRQR